MGRALRLSLKNPWLVKLVIREFYRDMLGIALDRRWGRGKSAYPVQLSINLTRRCNLNCDTCNQHRSSSETSEGPPWYDPARELPLSSWVSLLHQSAGRAVALIVTGGEPTLYREFAGFIREAKRLRFVVRLFTNGSTLTGHAPLLVEQGVELVCVSIDGPEEIHDSIRGAAGSFRRATEGMATLVEQRSRGRRAGPYVGINFTISKRNVGFMEEMVDVALGLGVDALRFQHTIFLSRSLVEAHNEVFSPEFSAGCNLNMVSPSIPEGEFYESQISQDDEETIRTGFERAKERAKGRLWVSFYPGVNPGLIGPYYLDLGYPFGGQCNGLWKSMRIMPDGTVSPCLHVVAGNITERPIEELWNGEVMRNLRKIVATGLFPGCARCCSRSFI